MAFANPSIAGQRSGAHRDVGSILASVVACSLIVLFFIASSERFHHWFVVPVLLCGVLIGADAADWVRRRRPLFDPIGIIGLVGLHFFFLAPLLHVQWDSWMRFVTPPPDWRTWLGSMAIVNLAGLVAYRFARRFTVKQPSRQNPLVTYRWDLHPRNFPVLLIMSLAVSGALQAYVYGTHGGIMGYITTYTTRWESEGAFQGLGWVFMISESFPRLAIVGYAFLASRHRQLRSWFVVITVLVAFLALTMLFGGLRGSRSNTVWALFFAVGVVHLFVRPVSRRLLLAGLPLLVGFMYVYGLYKGAGTDVVLLTTDRMALSELEEMTGRGIETTLLGDLARSDVQAFLLYRLFAPDSDFEVGLGRTYLGALAILVPRQIWPSRPPHKIKEGTDIQFGAGTFESGVRRSSRVYGGVGEFMLNFGPFLVPLAFFIFGLMVRSVRLWWLRLPSHDSRILLVPLAINIMIVLIIGDSDNALFFAVKNGALVTAVVLLGSQRRTDERLDPPVHPSALECRP